MDQAGNETDLVKSTWSEPTTCSSNRAVLVVFVCSGAGRRRATPNIDAPGVDLSALGSV